MKLAELVNQKQEDFNEFERKLLDVGCPIAEIQKLRADPSLQKEVSVQLAEAVKIVEQILVKNT